MKYDDVVLLTPRNDEESLMIVQLAEAAGIPTCISAQPHGARLEREEKLVERLRATNPRATQVFIVEIPGPATEDALRTAGFDVHIIDHHRYDALDRMREKSSLEQFLEAFGFNDAELEALGYNPVLVRGVGMIDRGFLWALRNEIVDTSIQKAVRDYYRSLTLQLGKDREAIELAAREAWDKREVRDGVIIVRSERKDVGIRDAISFLVADSHDAPPQVIVIEGDRRMFVQESDAAPLLFAEYGGFTFGRDRCWGIQATKERAIPALKDVMTRLAK